MAEGRGDTSGGRRGAAALDIEFLGLVFPAGDDAVRRSGSGTATTPGAGPATGP